MRRSIALVPFAALAWLCAGAALASGWQCRNADLEVQCQQGRCASQPGFTPTELRLGGDGTLEVCAYSGCVSGPARRLREGALHLFVGRNLQPQGPGEPRDAALLLDTGDGIALFKSGAFATPMACSRG